MYFKGTNTTLDIADGKTINSIFNVSKMFSFCPFTITEDASVTFTGNGTITGTSAMIQNSGNLTINGGRYSDQIMQRGNITINGGYFNAGTQILFQSYPHVVGNRTIINGGEFYTREGSMFYYNEGDDYFTITNGLFISEGGFGQIGNPIISGGTFIHKNTSGSNSWLLGIQGKKAIISGGDFYVANNNEKWALKIFDFAFSIKEKQITGGRYSMIDGLTPSSGFEWKRINEPALLNTNPLLYQIVPSAK